MFTTQWKMDPALTHAIEAAKSHRMTAEEIQQQRVSFIYSSVGPDTVTREQIKHILNEQEGKVTA